MFKLALKTIHSTTGNAYIKVKFGSTEKALENKC